MYWNPDSPIEVFDAHLQGRVDRAHDEPLAQDRLPLAHLAEDRVVHTGMEAVMAVHASPPRVDLSPLLSAGLAAPVPEGQVQAGVGPSARWLDKDVHTQLAGLRVHAFQVLHLDHSSTLRATYVAHRIIHWHRVGSQPQWHSAGCFPQG